MNPRILFVEGSQGCLEALGGQPIDGLDVLTASSGRHGLELCRRDGPFAAIVAEYELPGRNGIELLAAVRERWPNTARILVTGNAELDVAIEALHQGQILRMVRKPCDAQALRDAIDAGIEHHAELEQERLFVEQLLFSRESLLALAEVLDRRLTEEIVNQKSMQSLTERLSSTSSLQEVAELSASAISRALGGRSTRVRLDNPNRDEKGLGLVGGEPASDCHTESVRTPEGELGTIAVERSPGRECELTERDRRVLSALVTSTALAARSQIRRRERDQAQLGIALAMARLAEQRDNETAKHLQRVSEYCRLIALGLREDGHYTDEITDEFVVQLYLSAPLHDIGKVAMPDSILHKPGKLDPDEWEVMKQHALIGSETMRSIIECTARPGFLRMGRDIAWCHHERWDGSGYPRGLKAEAIPLSARIVAVADVYDALSTRRPYKEPWTHARSLAQIAEDKGRHFDPRAAEAFLKRADQVDEIRIRLADDPEEAAKLSGAA